MKRFSTGMIHLGAAALIWLLLASAQAVQAEEFDPGFGEYDPKRVCYQQWCFMGNEPGTIGTIVLPDHYTDGVGLGVFIDRKHIEFSEMPFAKGVYRVESLVEINVQGRMEVGHLYNGAASYRNHTVNIPLDARMADLLMRGRFLKVKIYRGRKLEVSARVPLYGITSAYRHLEQKQGVARVATGGNCQEVKQFRQAEQRDGSGTISVEDALIHVLHCGRASNQLYIYEYLRRPGFRVIRPPEWGNRLGGRDFDSFSQALDTANAANFR